MRTAQTRPGNGAKTRANGSKTRAGADEQSVLLNTLIAFKRGNFAIRMPVDQTGIQGKIADTLNDLLELNQNMGSEFARISQTVGKDGKISQRMPIGSASGAWTKRMDSISRLIRGLVQPSTVVAR